MRYLLLIREPRQSCTMGSLYVDGHFYCHTLEDVEREHEKIYGETAIPKGLYDVIMSYSPRFKRPLPELLNVPNFTNVRIHSGNSVQDTDGCILVGIRAGVGYLNSSRITSDRLNDTIMKSCGGVKIKIA